MREFGAGAAGQGVERWQRFLIRRGHLAGPASGAFSAETEAATKAFQAAAGLPPTGRADAPTLAAALLAEPETPAATPAEPRRGRDLALFGTLGAATIALLGNALVAFLNGQNALEAEREKLRSSIMVEAIRTNGDTVQAVTNLRFFAQRGFIRLTPEQLRLLEEEPNTVPTTTSASAGGGAAVGPGPAPAGAPPGAAAAAPGAPAPTAAYRVFVQFAGALERQQVREMMRRLSVEWRVQGVEAGGERTPEAAGQNEVRYGAPSDERVAGILASSVQQSGILAPNQAVRTVLNPRIPRGTLEVWISR